MAGDDLKVVLTVQSDELDAEELDTLLGQIRRDLQEADFEAHPTSGTAVPDGAKAVEATMTAIEIVVAGTMHVAFLEALERIRSFRRHRQARMEMSAPGKPKVEISQLTAEELAARLEALLA